MSPKTKFLDFSPRTPARRAVLCSRAGIGGLRCLLEWVQANKVVWQGHAAQTGCRPPPRVA